MCNLYFKLLLFELSASHKAGYIEMVHVTALIGRMPAVICLVHLWIREFTMYVEIYSLTCVKRSPLGKRKSGLLRQMTS